MSMRAAQSRVTPQPLLTWCVPRCLRFDAASVDCTNALRLDASNNKARLRRARCFIDMGLLDEVGARAAEMCASRTPHAIASHPVESS